MEEDIGGEGGEREECEDGKPKRSRHHNEGDRVRLNLLQCLGGTLEEGGIDSEALKTPSEKPEVVVPTKEVAAAAERKARMAERKERMLARNARSLALEIAIAASESRDAATDKSEQDEEVEIIELVGQGRSIDGNMEQGRDERGLEQPA